MPMTATQKDVITCSCQRKKRNVNGIINYKMFIISYKNNSIAFLIIINVV